MLFPSFGFRTGFRLNICVCFCYVLYMFAGVCKSQLYRLNHTKKQRDFCAPLIKTVMASLCRQALPYWVECVFGIPIGVRVKTFLAIRPWSESATFTHTYFNHTGIHAALLISCVNLPPAITLFFIPYHIRSDLLVLPTFLPDWIRRFFIPYIAKSVFCQCECLLRIFALLVL